ncbi:MAG: translocation/assembly module TamB domain-containing protein [Candidatus Eremiobacteraeota bacterium]|nr:translocation/assembly module TamB domain-containing protein [Candidatus Eremiobacteraeota bacterium]
MKQPARRRVLAAVLAIALALAAVVAVEREALARIAIDAAARGFAHVSVAYGTAAIGWHGATFDGLVVTSTQGEPIARVERASIGYDAGDLLAGRRLLGITSLTLDRAHVEIVRHADGTYNVPIPQLPSGPQRRQAPVAMTASLRDGSIDVIDQGNVDPHQRHLFVRNADVTATLASEALTTYDVALTYGERRDQLFPIRGAGKVDARSGYGFQHWTARYLPIAGAVDFALDSPSLHVAAGHLERLDARIAGIPVEGAMQTHLAATALLSGARVAIGGLNKPVDDVRGRIDLDEAGLSISRLDATLAGVPVTVTGGAFLRNGVQARLAIRGHADLAQLRNAFAQAARLPMRGPIDFAVLAEGNVSAPVEWIAAGSPYARYAGSTVGSTEGLIAFDGQEADVTHFTSTYRGIAFQTRGRAALGRRQNAVQMFASADVPATAVPYGPALVPGLTLHAFGLARADDPKNIAVAGTLTGTGAAERVDGTFDVAGNGTGSIGPIVVAQPGGRDLYVRAALDRPHGRSVALVDAHGFALPDIGVLHAHGIVAMQGRSVRGNVAGTLASANGGSGAVVASLRGTTSSPRLAASVLLANERYRTYDLNGAATVAFAGGTLAIRDALAEIGPAFVRADGTIAGIARANGVPHYDINARLESSDTSALLAAARARLPQPLEGSVVADVHVGGTASSPAVAGTFEAPEGSINGLAFRDLRATIDGSPSAMTLDDGRVVVGDTAIAFSGNTSGSAMHVALDAPHADLSDFNDYFDAGDMFAGKGALALDASATGSSLLASSGSAHFTGARFRRIELGTVAANWDERDGELATQLAFGGPTGRVAVSGSLQAPFDRLRVTPGRALTATARNLDLATWLPMLGTDVPVTGKLNAEVAVTGTYPDLATRLHAGVFGGTAGRVAIERFTIAASTNDGRGRIDSAVLQIPNLTTTVSGTFGLHDDDPLALSARTTSDSLGALAKELSGKVYDADGTLDSMLAVTGTRIHPRIVDDVALHSLRYGKLTVPSAKARIVGSAHSVAITAGEADLQKGRVLLDAAVPIRIAPGGIAFGNGPVTATLVAQDVDAVNASALFEKGTHVGGRVDGSIRLGGTLHAPQLHGRLALTRGAFIGPMERAPIKDAQGTLVFEGSRIALTGAHADVGGGSVAADGDVAVRGLRSLQGLAFALHARSDNAHLEMPAYFTGNVDGAIALSGSVGRPATLRGSVAISSARIPPTAFFNPHASKEPQHPLPPIAFDDFRVQAGRDVRVQSGAVDVGGRGAMTLAGTLANPKISGGFESTGGTIDFYHTFTLQRARVAFERGSGIMPYVDAVASTYIPDPATAIRMHVTGQVPNMNLAFASDPDYDREQILGLLLGVNRIGAVRGVSSGNTASGGFSVGGTAQSLALGQVNTAFSRQLLEPLSAQLGAALGFSDLHITNDLQTGLGLGAAKAFGKNLTAAYDENFGQPKTQTVALEAHPSIATSLRMRVYSTSGPSLVGIGQAQSQPSVVGLDAMNLNPMTALAASSGTNGVDFSYVHRFPP